MTEQTNIRTRSKLRGCLIFALIPIVLLGIAAIVLVINNRPPNIKVPTHSVPKDNGFDYFMRAGDMAKKIGHPGPYSDYRINGRGLWTLPKLEAFVKANAPALAALRQGLAKQYMHPAQRSLDQYPMYCPRIRELACTLRGEALYYKKMRDYGKAADSLLDELELGVTVPRGGILYTGLVGVKIEAISVKDWLDVVGMLNAKELAHVAKRLEAIQAKRWPFSEIVLEEGRYTTAMLVEVFSKSKDRNQVINPNWWAEFALIHMLGDEKANPTLRDWLVYIWPYVCFAFENKTKIISELDMYHKAVAAEVRKPYSGNSKVPVPSGILADANLFNPISTHRKFAISMARLNLIQTEVALRRYNAATGHYPDKLAQLAPTYLKSVPIDPFGIGKPLRYRPLKSGKSFLLYSLGPNMKDDGGKPDTQNHDLGDIALEKGN